MIQLVYKCIVCSGTSSWRTESGIQLILSASFALVPAVLDIQVYVNL